MAILKSFKTILVLEEDGPDWAPEGQYVDYVDEEGEHSWTMPAEKWLDFGKPSEITVTVEPGRVIPS